MPVCTPFAHARTCARTHARMHVDTHAGAQTVGPGQRWRRWQGRRRPSRTRSPFFLLIPLLLLGLGLAVTAADCCLVWLCVHYLLCIPLMGAFDATFQCHIDVGHCDDQQIPTAPAAAAAATTDDSKRQRRWQSCWRWRRQPGPRPRPRPRPRPAHASHRNQRWNKHHRIITYSHR